MKPVAFAHCVVPDLAVRKCNSASSKECERLSRYGQALMILLLLGGESAFAAEILGKHISMSGTLINVTRNGDILMGGSKADPFCGTTLKRRTGMRFKIGETLSYDWEVCRGAVKMIGATKQHTTSSASFDGTNLQMRASSTIMPGDFSTEQSWNIKINGDTCVAQYDYYASNDNEHHPQTFICKVAQGLR